MASITTKTVHLQGIGERPAIKVADLKPGMVIIYNYGYRSEVVEVTTSKSGKSASVTTRSFETGKIFTRTRRIDTLVAVELPEVEDEEAKTEEVTSVDPESVAVDLFVKMYDARDDRDACYEMLSEYEKRGQWDSDEAQALRDVAVGFNIASNEAAAKIRELGYFAYRDESDGYRARLVNTSTHEVVAVRDDSQQEVVAVYAALRNALAAA